MTKSGGDNPTRDLERLLAEGALSPAIGESSALLLELASIFLTSGEDAVVSTEPQRLQAQPAGDYQTVYQILAEQIPAVVFLAFLDQGLSHAYISPYIEQVLGYSRKEWLSDPVLWFKRLHADDKERWSLEAAQMLLSGEPLRSTYRVLARSGRPVWLQCDVRLVRRASGEPWLVHGVAFDVTELKEAQDALTRGIAVRERLERQLLQTQKMESIGTLAAGLAHDFNNILTIIQGYARRLTLHGRDSGEVREDADAITSAAARGARLIRQLLTFAQKGPVDTSSMDLNGTVRDFAGIIRETFPRTIELAIDLDPRLPAIHGDANQISQLLLNITVNARDAMPEGGTLSIRTAAVDRKTLKRRFPEAASGAYVALRIADTGMGMDESVRSRIFEPFFTTKETGKGTGLGLAVVYGIVQTHHGFVDVESAVGQGTTFHFYFPVEPRR